MSASRFRYVNAERLPVSHEKLTAAVDGDGRCLAHIADQRVAPELHQLLAVHRARTGVPGLINVPLAAPHGLVGTPVPQSVKHSGRRLTCWCWVDFWQARI